MNEKMSLMNEKMSRINNKMIILQIFTNNFIFLVPKGYLWNENTKEHDSKGGPLESAKNGCVFIF